MKRSVKYELNAVVAVVIVLTIIVFVSLISRQHDTKWDLTSSKANTLSLQSSDLIKGLTKDVKAVCFTSNPSKRSSIEHTLKMYRSEGSRFSYEFHDPVKHPLEAEKYNVLTDPVIYLEIGAKREKIDNFSEESITNAIARLLSDKEKVVYSLTGHGELLTEGGDPLKSMSVFKTNAEREVYKVKPLSIVEEGKIPDDASMLIIAGPSSPIHAKEMDVIEKYMENGGRTLWLLGKNFPKENRKIFDKYGFSVYDGYIEDETSKMIGFDSSIAVILAVSPSDITKGFTNLENMYLLPLCCALKPEKQVDGITLLPLFATTGNAVLVDSGKTEKKNVQEGYVVASSMERNIKDTEKTEKMIVIGSSMMAGDNIIVQGENLNLLLNASAWLTGEKNLIAIRPKDETTVPLDFTPLESHQFFFKTVIMFPVLLISLWFSLKMAKIMTRKAGKK